MICPWSVDGGEISVLLCITGALNMKITSNTNVTSTRLVTFIDEKIQLNYKSDEENNEKHKKKIIDINNFSFLQSIEASKDFKGSFSNSLIEERNLEL